MRDLTRIVLVLLLGATGNCLAQSVRKTEQKPTGAIAGRITLERKGLAGARISVIADRGRYPNGTPISQGKSDGDGKFRISNLRAGAYRLLLGAPAFVVADASGPLPSEKPIVVNEGETVEGVDFALIRGGVITGKVSDSNGRPVIGEVVSLTPTDQYLERITGMLPVEIFLTDDRGVYRIYGLPPGSYKVSVGEEYEFLSTTRGRRTFRQTFYTDAMDNKAKVVELSPGAEVSNIDITVGGPIDGFSVSGRILDAESGRPVSGARFGLAAFTSGGSAFMGDAGNSDSHGNFRLDNVPPGRYSIRIATGNGTEYFGETSLFDVVDQDVRGLEIKAQRAATLAGMVALEGAEDKTILAMLSQLHLQAVVRGDYGGYISSTELPLSSDGSFRLAAVSAGIVRISLNFRRKEGSQFSVLRVERDGIDQTQGLKVKPGEQVTGVRVIVAHGTGRINGTLKVENGTVSPAMYVVAQLTRQTPGGAVTVSSAAVDSRGRFILERLPAGNYELTITIYNPADPGKPMSFRQPVAITDGIDTEISVPINLKPN